MKKLILFLCACLLTVGIVLPAAAITPIDPAKPSSLTLQYSFGGKAFEGLRINTYRIAEVFPDGTYELTGDFASYPVNIHGITSQAEWKQITSTLAAYIAADSLAPSATLTTNASGVVAFRDILPGMYLTTSVRVESPKEVVIFENFITVIPYPADDGGHDYDVVAYPKYDSFTPSEREIEYKVIKLWSDKGSENKRPASLEIEILKNGSAESVVTLSAENNYSYTWSAPDDGSIWQAVERNIPEGYTVTVDRSGNSFVITNTLKTEDPDSPPTGDTVVVWHFALPMSLAGGVLLVIAAWRKRSEDAEEKN